MSICIFKKTRLENLRKLKEQAEAAELKERPEISKNSDVILSKSKKFKSKGDLYKRCMDFRKEKEVILILSLVIGFIQNVLNYSSTSSSN